MGSRMISTAAKVSILVALTGVAMPAFAWEPPAEAQNTLASGKPWDEVLPDGHGAGIIHAAIDIAAPPSTVWAILTRCGGAHLAATMKSCKVIQGDQNIGWDVRERITKGSLFTPSIRDVIYTQYIAPLSVRFHRVGGDLKTEEGETRLEPIDGGAATRVVYVNRIALNTVLPEAILRAAMRHATPEVLVNLQRNSLAAAGPGSLAVFTPSNQKQGLK